LFAVIAPAKAAGVMTGNYELSWIVVSLTCASSFTCVDGLAARETFHPFAADLERCFDLSVHGQGFYIDLLAVFQLIDLQSHTLADFQMIPQTGLLV
jgi:hypothetical protein